ncbi:iron ABC transporter permease [Vibrio mimicus]
MKIILGILVLLTIALIHLMSGARPVHIDDVFYAITDYNPKNYAHVVIIKQRMSRLGVTLCLGAMLAVSGFVLQKLLRNDLVSPSTLGINSGASAFTIAGIYFFGDIGFNLFWASLLGGVSALILSFFAANQLNMGQRDPINLALGGVISSTLFAGIATFLLSLDPDRFGKIIGWLVGDIGIFDYQILALFWPLTIISIGILLTLSRSLDVMALGHEQATSLGLNPQKIQWISLACAIILPVIAVTVSGPIGFIGLVVPHIVRLLANDYGRGALVFAAIIGSSILTSADTIARSVLSPHLLNVGTVMALIGGVGFLSIIIIVLRKPKC